MLQCKVIFKLEDYFHPEQYLTSSLIWGFPFSLHGSLAFCVGRWLHYLGCYWAILNFKKCQQNKVMGSGWHCLLTPVSQKLKIHSRLQSSDEFQLNWCVNWHIRLLYCVSFHRFTFGCRSFKLRKMRLFLTARLHRLIGWFGLEGTLKII